MKAYATLLFAMVIASTTAAQEFQQSLKRFDRIVVSPKVNLVLVEGREPGVRIQYTGVNPEEIVVKQIGKRVHIYLENAKIIDTGIRQRNMFDRRERYRHASVTAYVTFQELRLIETRGEEEVSCDDKIVANKLTIRAYGVANLHFAQIEAAKVKTRLYGENTMNVDKGEAGHVSYKLYGENKVDSRALEAVTSSTTIYGEGRISLYASEELRINSIGEPSLHVSGSPIISKGIMIGNTSIRRH